MSAPIRLALTLMLLTGLSACGTKDASNQYRTEALSRGDIAETVTANGQLSPVTLVSVGTQVSGIVQSYSADFNDRVSDGQVLMRLDDSLIRAQLTQSRANLGSAQANLRLAQNNWTRIQPLVQEGFASSQEQDQVQQALAEARARVSQAQAQLDRDEVNLSYTVIRSPVAGVVVSRAVDVGQTVAASFQTPELYQIAQDLRQMVINAYFTESDIGRIKVGQSARFRVDAYPDRSFQGLVQQVRLNPRTEQNVVTYDVVISVDNPDEILLPGMTASVSIVTQERQDILRVPTAALRFRPPADANTNRPRDNNGSTLWILQAGKLTALPVRLGITDRRYTEVITDNIDETTRVVIERVQDAKTQAGSGLRFRMSTR